MVKQTRTLHYKPYSVVDEDNWSWLIWGLNGDAKSEWTPEAKKRVSSLLLNMRELDEIREKLRTRFSEQKRSSHRIEMIEWPSWVFGCPQLEELNSNGRRLLLKVNAKLGFYKWSPNILTINFDSFREHSQSNTRSESDYQEQVAVQSLLQELAEGRINRFRVCRQCQRWFYAVTAHQISCSEACRKKHASTSEDFKAKRRKYMKKYRKQEQARNKRANLQVKTHSKAR